MIYRLIFRQVNSSQSPASADYSRKLKIQTILNLFKTNKEKFSNFLPNIKHYLYYT